MPNSSPQPPALVDLNLVIVVFRNSQSDVEQLLSYLFAAADEAGLETRATIVLNDESTYPSSSRIAVISGQGNVGFASGVSLGVDAVASEYVAIVNPDCFVQTSDMKRFFSRLKPGCGILVPILEKEAGKVDIAIYENWVFTPTKKIAYFVSRRFLLQLTASRLPRLMKAPGTFIGMETTTARALDNPFDREFYLYGEDRDLTSRARKARIPVQIVRDVRVLHPGGGSTEGMKPVVDRGKADGMLRVAFRRYGRVGFELMVLNIIVEAWIKDRLRGSALLPARRWVIRRWRISLPAQAPPMSTDELRDETAL